MSAQTIFEQLKSLTDRVAALEVRANIETTGLATADSVSKLTDRVVLLEGEVGTPPAEDAGA